MKTVRVAVCVVLLLVAPVGVKGMIGIPVIDLTSWLGELISFAEELAKIKEFIGLYKTLSFKLGERVRDVKKGFEGIVGEKIEGMVKLDKKIVETLEDSSYYAEYVKGTLFERVNGGEKLLDIVKEIRDIESEIKSREIYKDPIIKQYTEEYIEAYKERVNRLENRILFLMAIKETGKSRLSVFGDRYKLFEDAAEGVDSKAGSKIGSESKAISLLSESIIDTALQDQEISIMMRLGLEEEVSYELNKIYLDNLKLSTIGKGE